MRRLYLIFLFIFLLCFSFKVKIEAAETDDKTYEQQYTVNDVLKSSIKAYNNSSKYSGKQIKTNLKIDDILDFEISDFGGIMRDGEGTLAFANFASVSIKLKTKDSSMKLPDVDARIISERSYKVHGDRIGSDSTIELKKKIGYGVILTSVEASNGYRDLSEEIYIGHYNDCLDNLRITKNGNYHFVILMTVSENGTKKKLSIEFTIPIRTSIYITDQYGEYHVKDVGSYYGPIMLDSLDRPNTQIYVNNYQVNNKYVIKDIGTYDIKVMGNGFVCERFKFTIFDGDVSHALIYLSNVRSRLDTISYECENNFKITWYCSFNSTMTYWKEGNPNLVYEYKEGTVITTPGTYIFTLETAGFANEKNSFLVSLVENDEPVINYQTLNQNRFNNFKTKWYEVYDEEADSYYCYSLNEYIRAYDTALTLEKNKTFDSGFYVTYNGTKYYDKLALSNAINKNALDNLKVVYYDLDDSYIEKYFSNNNFDGTVYLNRDFQFVRTSPAESNLVTIVDENDNEIVIDYFTPLELYNLTEGNYTITEEDLYGNKITYNGIVDTSVPDISLYVDGEQTTIIEGNYYQGNYFSLNDLYDKYDSYAVVAVEHTYNDITSTSYYYKDEIDTVVFAEIGDYQIKVYDRNNNVMRFYVSISDDKQYVINKLDNAINFKLTSDYYEVTSIIKNNEVLDIDLTKSEYTFYANDKKDTYLIYTIDKRTGEKDCLYIEVSLVDELTDVSNEPIDFNIQPVEIKIYNVIIISVFIIIGVILINIVVIKYIWRCEDE